MNTNRTNGVARGMGGAAGRDPGALARAAGTAGTPARPGPGVWSLAAGSALLAAAPALGQIAGQQVAKGSASFVRFGNQTTITASRNAVINYSSFNIRPNESVQFVQPDSLSRVLNRINSALPSRIDGQLMANGRVYIVNPSGVIFGRGAMIDVGGIYAAAGSISDGDFLRGQDRFITSAHGKVVNEGTIQANVIGLIGKQVFNFGTLEAREGTVMMVSGDEVLLGEQNGHVFARIEKSGEAATGPAAPDGAGSGTPARFGAGDVYALAVWNTGAVKARQVHAEASRGSVQVAGSIDASDRGRGGTGGSVKILGPGVGILGASIDASGDAGGGEVLIGGNFQGQGPERNAVKTVVTEGSTIKADAISEGDGGKVIVWSDYSTRFDGAISARGGESSGDGGFAEISGKTYLQSNTNVDLGAPKGDVGTVLYDPLNIEIRGGSGDGSDDSDTDSTDLDDGGGTTGTIGFNDEGGAGPDDPFVIFESEIEGTNNNIILQARRSIITSGTFNNDADGAGTIDPGTNVVLIQSNNNLVLQTLNDTADSADGVINLASNSFGTPNTSNSALTFRAQGTGTVTIQAATDTTSPRVGNVTLGGLRTANRDVLVTTGNGTVTLLNDLNAGTGDVRVQATGAVTQSAGNITADQLGVRAGGGITVESAGNNAVTVAFDDSNAASAVSYRDADAYSVGVVGAAAGFGTATGFTATAGITTNNGDVLLRGGAITIAEAINAGDSATGGDVGIDSTGAVTETTGVITGVALGVRAGGVITLAQSGNDFAVGAFRSTGSAVSVFDSNGFNVETVGSADVAGFTDTTGVFSNGSDVLLDSGAGGLILEAPINAGAGVVRLASDDQVRQFNATAVITAGSLGVDAGRVNVGAQIELGVASSNVGVFAAKIANTPTLVRFRDSDGYQVGSVAGQTVGSAVFTATTGITATDGAPIRLIIDSGTVTQNAAITTTGSLSLLGTGTYTLNDAANDVGTLDTETGGGAGTLTGSADFRDAGTLALGPSTVTGTLTVRVDAGALSNGGNTISAGNAVFEANDIALTGAATVLSPSATGTLTLRPLADGDSVSVGTGAVAGTLDIDATDIAAIGAFGGGITIGRTTGTALTSIGDATFADHITIVQGGADGDVTLESGRALVATNPDAGGESITLRAGTGATGTFTQSAGAGTFITATGSVVITADRIVLDGDGNSISGGGTATLQPASANRPMSIAINNGDTDFELKATELATLANGFASITIGRTNGNANVLIDSYAFMDPITIQTPVGGTMTVQNTFAPLAGQNASVTLNTGGTLDVNFPVITDNAEITLRAGAQMNLAANVNAGTSIIRLVSGGGINQTAGALLAGGLGVRASGAVTLRQAANDVDIFALNNTGGLSQYTDFDGLSVDTIGPDSAALFANTVGITTTGQDVIVAAGGALAFDSASDLGAGTLLAQSGGAVSQTAPIAANGLGVVSTGGSIDLSDALNDVSAFAARISAIGVGTGITFRDADAFSVGSFGAQGDFTLGAAGVTSTFLNGDVLLHAGASLTLADNVSASAGNGIVRLVSGAGIDQTGGVIAASQLGVLAQGAVTLNSTGNDVNTLAIENTGANAVAQFADTDGVTVDQVLASGTFTGATGVQTDNGNILLNAGAGAPVGDLVVNQLVDAGTGEVRLVSDGAITQTGGSILASLLGARAGTGITLAGAGNDANTFAANTDAGGVVFTDLDALAIGNVGASGAFLNTNGVTTAGGDATLTAGGALTVGAGFSVATAGGTALLDGASLTINGAVNAGAGTVLLVSDATVTEGAAGAVTGTVLGVNAAGAVQMNGPNAVGTLAVRNTAAGVIEFNDVGGLTIGQVLGQGTFTTATGVVSVGNSDILLDAGAGPLSITQAVNSGTGTTLLVTSGATGTIAQSAAITAGELGVQSGAAVDLTLATNDVNVLAATTSGAQLRFTDIDDLSVGQVGANGDFAGATGVNTGASGLSLTAGTTLAQTQDVTAGALTLSAGGAITFDRNTNNAASLSAASTAGAVTYHDANGLTVTALSAGGGDALLRTGSTMTLNGAIGAAGTLRLVSLADIGQTGGSIVAGALGVRAVGAATLNQATNNVGTFAGLNTGAGAVLEYTNFGGLTIGTVAGSGAFGPVSGATADGSVSLVAGGVLDLGAAVASANGNALLNSGGALDLDFAVSAPTGDIRLVAAGAVTQSVAVLGSRLGVIAGSVDLPLLTNNVGTFGARVSGAGTIVYRDADELSVGAVPALGTFLGVGGLRTLGGDALVTSGAAMTLDDTLDVAGGTLRLVSGGALTKNDGDIIASALAVNAAGDIALDAANVINNVATFAASSTAAGGTVQYTDNDALTIGAVPASGGLGGASGVTTDNGVVTINAGGALTVDDSVATGGADATLGAAGALTVNTGSVNVGGGVLTLQNTAGDITQNAGTLTAGSLLVVAGTGNVVLGNAGNDTGTLAASLSGANSSLLFRDANSLDVNTVAGTDGITTANGDVSLRSGAGTLTLSQDIGAGTGTVRFNAAGGVNQAAGAVSAGALGIEAGGPIALLSVTNNVGTFAATTSGGAVQYRDTDALVIGTVTGGPVLSGDVSGVTTTAADSQANILAGGSITVSDAVLTADGNALLTAGGTMTVNAAVAAAGAGRSALLTSADSMAVNAAISGQTVNLGAGTGGSGNLSFGAGASVSGETIALSAGDGDNVGAAAVDARTNSPTFLGSAGGASSPADFSITQDADLTDTLIPERTQFGADVAGIDYHLTSLAGGLIEVFESAPPGTTKFDGSNLTLTGTNIQITTPVLNVNRLVISGTTLADPVEITATAGLLTVDGDFTIVGGRINVFTGTLTFNGSFTSTQGPLDLDAGVINFLGDVTINGPTGGATIDANTINFGDALGDDVSVSGTLAITAGLVDFFGALTSTGSLTINTDEVNFRDSVGGGGTFTLAPITQSLPIVLGQAGANLDPTAGLDLTDAELDLFTGGFSTIAIGRSDGTGSMQFVGQTVFNDPVEFRMAGAGGDFQVNADVTGVGDASLVFFGSGATFTLAADIITEGQAIFIDDAVEVVGARTLSTTGSGAAAGADIGITGAIDAASGGGGLVITAGTDGAVDLDSAVGSTTALNSLTASGNAIRLAAVTTSGAQTYSGATTLGGNLTISGAGAVTITGPITLDSPTLTIRTGGAAGDNITLNGSVDGAAALTLNSGGAGQISLGGNVGSLTALTSLSLTGNTNLTAPTLAITTTGGVTAGGNINGGTALTINTGTGILALGGSIGNSSPLSSLTVNGNTQLNATPLSVDTANGPIVFNGNLDGDSALTLDAGTGSVTIAGITGASDSLVSLAVNGSTISVGAVTTEQSQTYTGATTLAGNLTSTDSGTISVTGNTTLAGNVTVQTAGGNETDSISFGGGTINGPFTLIASAGAGRVTFGGAVGQSTALTNLYAAGSTVTLGSVTTTSEQSYTGSTRILLGGDLAAGSGPITFNGPVKLNSTSVTVTAGFSTPSATSNINFLNTVDLAAAGDLPTGQTPPTESTLFAITSQGTARFGQAVGAVGALRSLFVQAAGIELNNVRTISDQAYTGATTLSGNLTTTGGTQAQTAHITVNGAAFLNNSAITISTGNPTGTGASSADADITFLSTLDGASNLVLNANGGQSGVVLSDDAGSSTPLTSLSVTADATRLRGDVRTTGNQSFSGETILGQNLAGVTTVEATAGSIRFGGPLFLLGDSAVRGGGSTGTVFFGGAVETATAALTDGGEAADTQRSLAVSSAAAAGIASTGNNFLTGAGFSITNTVPIMFNGNVGGDFLGSVGGAAPSDAQRSRMLKSLSLNVGTLSFDSQVPRSATIVMTRGLFNAAGNGSFTIPTNFVLNASDASTVRILTTEGFSMGQSQKLLAVGNFYALALNGNAVLSDITSLVNIEVDVRGAGQILIQPRPAGTLITNQFGARSDGTQGNITVNDLDTDFVALGRVNFSKLPQVLALPAGKTGQARARFSTPLGPSAGLNVNGKVQAPSTSLLRAEFKGAEFGKDLLVPTNPALITSANPHGVIPGQAQVGMSVDLGSEGVVVVGLGSALAGALPSDQGRAEAEQAVGLAADIRDELRALGLAIKDPTGPDAREAAFEALSGRSLYDDVPELSNPQAQRGDYQVTSDRLNSRSVQNVLNAYYDLAGTDAQARSEQLVAVQDAIGNAWRAYNDTLQGTEPDPYEFRRFVEAAPDQQPALDALNKIRTFLQRLDQLAISEVEAQAPKYNFLKEVTPSQLGMTVKQLEDAALGPAPVAGL